jgi:hypothetical protein
MGLTVSISKDLLGRSMNSEFAVAPELSSEPSLMKIFENFAYRAAPLNENAKPFDPERPFFDYSIELNIPEIEKDFNEGYISKYLPVDHSHPYLELFFDSPIKTDEYHKRENYKEKQKPQLERKPLRVEAIVKIQRALGVRLRSEGIFNKSIKILESFIESSHEQLDVEQLEILDAEYQDFANLCKDANYFLKKSSLRSSLGKSTFERISKFEKFKEQSKF